MNQNGKLRRIAAMILTAILVLQVQPLDAEDRAPGRQTFYSDWWSTDGTPSTLEYTFTGVGNMVLLPFLLGQNGIYGHIEDVMTDSDQLVLDDSLFLTAAGYFDTATLTVTLNGSRTYTFLFHNPGPETPIPAGTEVTGENGSFKANGETPAGTALSVGPFAPTDALLAALPQSDDGIQTVWMDIGLTAPDGSAVHAGADVTVKTNIELPAPPEVNPNLRAAVKNAKLYHVTGENTLEELPVEVETENGFITALRFATDSFSGFALSYTVDFAYTVNGQTYAFTLPGGGFVTIRQLVEALGVLPADTQAADRFIADIMNVEFSDPGLVWTGKTEKNTTVGQMKTDLGLDCEYSADLTEAQIAEINASPVSAGEWLLISLKPFLTEETLTITMTNGDLWTVQVTDAQIKALYLSASGKLYEITVTYDVDAMIPDQSTLRITEFETGSEEYVNARKAVLADMLARGEEVNPESFGLAALDISIIGPDGSEIEPAAPVQVDMTIKALPGVEDLNAILDTLAVRHHVEVANGVVIETVFDGATKAKFRLDTDETVAAEGIVVNPETVNEEELTAPTPEDTEDIGIQFETAVFSTFSISWNNAYGNGVKVHYVDQDGNELNVKNSTFVSTLNNSSATPAYLIYDIDGYEYSATYRRYYENRRWNEQEIVPQLRRYNSGWYYSTNGGNWNNLSASNVSNKDEIYVVYNKKNDIAPGGTPTIRQSGDVEPPVDPRIDKTSTPNGDDTNTLALSLISDTAQLEVEKLADVIVVFDVSGSMSTSDMGGNTRLKAAQNAVKTLAEQLALKKNSFGEPLVRMSLIQFSTKASPVLNMTELTNSGLSTFEGYVNNLPASGGTNWDHALQLANEEDDLDPGRGTFVIFVTDGDPTFRNTRSDVTDAQLANDINNSYYNSDSVYGTGSSDYGSRCYDAAVTQGRAIRAAGKNLYTIGISNSVTKVANFNADVGGNGAYLAEDEEALAQAFADIEASISGALGWGNIQMTDGITNLSNTVQKTGLTQVGGDFEYYYAPAPANWADMTQAQKNAYTAPASAFVRWDPAAAGAGLATYNETTGAVEWNMGSSFMPEAGVTYQVRFKVWPSQEAYDTIARLNNGTLNYDELPEDIRAQIIKSGNSYTLKTNEPDAKTTYQSATKTGSTVTPSGETKTLQFPTVEDLNLHVDQMQVHKEWVNDLDPDARWKSDVTLLLTDGNGSLYKEIDLNEENDFTAEDNFISCGLAKVENGELIIYEQGHDFRLTEPAEYAYYWDLDSDIYRPMVIDSHLTLLVKTEAPAGMGSRTVYPYQGNTYYKIDGTAYMAVSTDDAAAAITATNIRRSNLNLRKTVVDENGSAVVSSEPFTFTITVNDTQDADVWFSVLRDPADMTTVVRDLTTNATAEIRDGEKTGYYHAPSGSQITVTVEPGWNLRFTNLPNGTTYTISENAKENYTFLGAAVDNDGQFTVTPGTATGSGTIIESNKQYTVTYTNTTTPRWVRVLKRSRTSSAPLQNAVFSLYTDSGYAADPKLPVKTGLTTGADGMIDLGLLAYGTYYLQETAAPAGYLPLTDPVVIQVDANGVTAAMSDLSLAVSGSKTDGYIATVPNTPLTVNLPIPVVKKLQGRDMEADEFNFVFQPIDLNGTRDDTAKQVATNPAALENEEAAFNFALYYTFEDIASAPYHDRDGNGVYYYVVFEEQGNAAGMIYAENQYVVKITLSLDDNNTLTATPQYYHYSGVGPLPAEATDNLQLST